MLFLPFFNPFSDRLGLLFTLFLYILGVDLLGSLFHTFSSFLFVFFIKFHHIFVQIFFPLDYCQMVLREYVLYIIRILLFTYIAKTFILLAAASNSGIGRGQPELKVFIFCLRSLLIFIPFFLCFIGAISRALAGLGLPARQIEVGGIRIF